MTKQLFLSALLACGIATGAMAQSEDKIESTDLTAEYKDFKQFRIGGYGELVAAFKDYGTNRFYGHPEGNPKESRNTIAMPRFVLAGDYRFNSKWSLGIEIEFEAGGVGTAYELENSENGEYETEMEKGGEVALEQFHITRLIDRAFNVRVGHMILPVGQNNGHHEPINFFGTVRPEGETTIVPNTWHETGIEFFGSFGRKYAKFNYQAFITTGLNANGFDRNTWVGSGKQGMFEVDNFTSPGYTARLDWVGVPGLRLGGAFYYCANTCSNSDKSSTYEGKKAPLRIWNIDAQYKNKYVEARMNYLAGSLTNSTLISSKNGKLSNKSGYTRVMPVAHHAVAVGGEVGLNLKGIFNGGSKFPVVLPFFRYEYYNPQQEVIVDDLNATPAEERNKVSMIVAGLNWRPIPNLVVKADYTTRSIGGGKYNSENEFAVGIAWTGWFYQK